VNPAAASLTVAQALFVAISVSAGSGNPTPTGSIVLSGGGYTSASTELSGGNATIVIPANALSIGTIKLISVYNPDAASSSVYLSTSGFGTVGIVPVQPGFSVSGSTVNVNPGATTGNASTITVTPAGGFTGDVTLTASITSGPSGAEYLPHLSFGTIGVVNITGASAGTATLTISTTAPTSTSLVAPNRLGLPWYAPGGANLACILLCAVPKRRRWQSMLAIVLLLVSLASGVLGCGGAGSGGGGGGITTSGTTAGVYSISVTLLLAPRLPRAQSH
jgi:hypothetical protein